MVFFEDMRLLNAEFGFSRRDGGLFPVEVSKVGRGVVHSTQFVQTASLADPSPQAHFVHSLLASEVFGDDAQANVKLAQSMHSRVSI